MADYIKTIEKIKEDLKDATFYNSALNVQADKDFRFLCAKTNCRCTNNTDLRTLTTLDNAPIGDFLVFGHKLEDKMAWFPKDAVKENLYVAVVCYKSDCAEEVLVFDANNFKFKDNKKTGMLGVKIKDVNKLKQYSFGYVLKNILEGETK